MSGPTAVKSGCEIQLDANHRAVTAQGQGQINSIDAALRIPALPDRDLQRLRKPAQTVIGI